MLAGGELVQLNDANTVEACGQHCAAVSRDEPCRHDHVEGAAVLAYQPDGARLAGRSRTASDLGVMRQLLGLLGKPIFLDVARRGTDNESQIADAASR